MDSTRTARDYIVERLQTHASLYVKRQQQQREFDLAARADKRRSKKKGRPHDISPPHIVRLRWLAVDAGLSLQEVQTIWKELTEVGPTPK